MGSAAPHAYINPSTRSIPSKLQSEATDQPSVQSQSSGLSTTLLSTTPDVDTLGQAVFNFSSASHSLLSVFRGLSGAHGPAIAAKAKDALAGQVAALLPQAEALGSVCVPTLASEQRDAYAKQVLAVQGLVALSSAVARNVSAMLPLVRMRSHALSCCDLPAR